MLSELDIKKVTLYIGVNGGYLGNFSYRTHAEFYSEYCNLDIDPYSMDGTTRERFIQILRSESSTNQVKILKGVLQRFPLSKFSEDELPRKQTLHGQIVNMIKTLEGMPISPPDLTITSEVVQRAIEDAKTLIEKNGATSGLDRVHTGLHGYMKFICEKENIKFSSENPSITELFKEIKKHPKMQASQAGSEYTFRILNSIANILDALNTIRNKSSIAHPNPNLLGEDESMFVINSAQTILSYLNSKFRKL